MELLHLVQRMQSTEYEYNLRRESFKNCCGMHLTDFQIGVLMANCVDNSQTIYAAQPRQAGTSTALLLKVYQRIFLENEFNDKHIISRSNESSRYLKDRMMLVLGQAGMTEAISRHSRYRIELVCGTIIHFQNNNPLNLTGSRSNCEFFFDDYAITDVDKNEAMSAAIFPTSPTHVHYFLASSEIEQEWTELLFN